MWCHDAQEERLLGGTPNKKKKILIFLKIINYVIDYDILLWANNNPRDLSQQRPRKVGAKFTGTGIAPDEHNQVQIDLDYDGKRDRWNGYDPEEHQRIVEEYAKVDLVRLFFILFLFVSICMIT